jgi:hypothetical protein
MKMIFMKRGEGKTTKLICMSYLNKIPIVVSNLKQVDYVKNKANSMGLEIPDPISGANINSLSKHLLGTGIKDVYVDNAEFMFKNLFEETFRVNLGGFSMSTDDTTV